MMDHVHRHTAKLLGGVLAIVAVIAVLDYALQRFTLMRSLRMSRQDLKDEFKQTEGDPMIRARLRQIRVERARRRMMQAVPEADVVVTNPTHYAVALKYVMTNMNAPKVVAKGVDEVALRIRAVAEKAGVPIVENPPLARALHGAIELDQEIAPEHYKAVAEVIGYVMRLRQGGKGGPARPRTDQSRPAIGGQ
jgi:flagellar biosynthetic protein FlhB